MEPKVKLRRELGGWSTKEDGAFGVGDVVISLGGETLAILCRWETDDEANYDSAFALAFALASCTFWS